jgi:hypothetical protein
MACEGRFISRHPLLPRGPGCHTHIPTRASPTSSIAVAVSSSAGAVFLLPGLFLFKVSTGRWRPYCSHQVSNSRRLRSRYSVSSARKTARTPARNSSCCSDWLKSHRRLRSRFSTLRFHWYFSNSSYNHLGSAWRATGIFVNSGTTSATANFGQAPLYKFFHGSDQPGTTPLAAYQVDASATKKRAASGPPWPSPRAMMTYLCSAF